MTKALSFRLSYDTLPMFTVTNCIRRALSKGLPFFKGKVLDVGCGNMPYKNIVMNVDGVTEYIGMDIIYPYAKVKPNLYWNGTQIPMPEASVDTVMLTEVLEHCPEPEIVLKEIFRVLKPEGFLFLTVPFLWVLHEVPHDEYRYTPFSLKRHLTNAGFTTVTLKKTGGWNASMAQMLSIWLGFGFKKKHRIIKIVLKFISIPIIYFLYKTDNADEDFEDLSMITGIYGLIRK